jgi:hypothetical protein
VYEVYYPVKYILPPYLTIAQLLSTAGGYTVDELPRTKCCYKILNQRADGFKIEFDNQYEINTFFDKIGNDSVAVKDSLKIILRWSSAGQVK